MTLLQGEFVKFRASFLAVGKPMPANRGRDKKLRDLDCAMINWLLDGMHTRGLEFDSVRGAFLEGDPIFEGTTISRESHLQIAVRNMDCILGVFRPNFGHDSS